MFEISFQTVAVMSSVGISALACALLWSSNHKALVLARETLSARPWLSVGLVASGGLAIWTGIFLLYGHPVSGDVPEFFLPQAHAVMLGAIPNKDFASSYMPLFPYVMAATQLVWAHLLSIPLFFTLCFIGVAAILYSMFRPTRLRGEVPWLLIIATMSGATWLLVIGYQQDEIFMMLLFLLASMFVLRGQDAAGGAGVALGLMATKSLFGIMGVALLMQARDWRKFAAGGALVVVLVGGYFMLQGLDPLRMATREAIRINPPSLTAMISMWPAAHALVMSGTWQVHAIVLAAILGAAYLFRSRANTRTTPVEIATGFVVIWMVFLLLSPKALTSYRIPILVLLPFVLHPLTGGRPWIPWLFAVYTFMLGIEYLFYEDWINMHYAKYLAIHSGNAEALGRLAAVALMDAVILACELYWLLILWRDRLGRRHVVASPAEAHA